MTDSRDSAEFFLALLDDEFPDYAPFALRQHLRTDSGLDSLDFVRLLAMIDADLGGDSLLNDDGATVQRAYEIWLSHRNDRRGEPQTIQLVPCADVNSDDVYALSISGGLWSWRLRGHLPSRSTFVEVTSHGTALDFVAQSSDSLIARLTLYEYSDQHQRAKLAVIVASRFRGSFEATASVAYFVDYAFRVLNLRKVGAEVSQAPDVSYGDLRALGAQREALLRSHAWDGVSESYVDVALYSVTRREWEASRAGALAFLFRPRSVSIGLI